MNEKWVHDGDWSIEQCDGQPFKDIVTCDGDTLFSVPDTYNDVTINTIMRIANQAYCDGINHGQYKTRFAIKAALGIN